ncbi:MAG: hypothetical protein EDR02_02310 [Actinobacteria bacterium]|nr:MAG: hypothetical protein EDR02_02310 [Actinomycetota bacterium]RIK07545.1 MAG: hypothetical protein DCC48_03325 [Acidobacteriota bacterium]
MTLVQRVRRRRANHQRGAAMVEAAIMTPLFFLLLFAALEFGLAFRNYLTVANTTRNAARIASAVGNDLNADFNILKEVKSASAAIPAESINEIVVFDAGSVNGSIEDVARVACKTASVSGVCNRYTPLDLELDEDDFGCEVADPDRFWCPDTRNVSLAVSGPPDYIGIYISVDYEFITGLFGSTKTFTDEVVIRLEPKEQ